MSKFGDVKLLQRIMVQLKKQAANRFGEYYVGIVGGEKDGNDVDLYVKKVVMVIIGNPVMKVSCPLANLAQILLLHT